MGAFHRIYWNWFIHGQSLLGYRQTNLLRHLVVGSWKAPVETGRKNVQKSIKLLKISIYAFQCYASSLVYTSHANNSLTFSITFLGVERTLEKSSALACQTVQDFSWQDETLKDCQKKGLETFKIDIRIPVFASHLK